MDLVFIQQNPASQPFLFKVLPTTQFFFRTSRYPGIQRTFRYPRYLLNRYILLHFGFEIQIIIFPTVPFFVAHKYSAIFPTIKHIFYIFPCAFQVLVKLFNIDKIEGLSNSKRTDRNRMFRTQSVPAFRITYRILSAISSCNTCWRLFGAARPDSWQPFHFAVGRECPASAPMDSRRTRTRLLDTRPPPCTIPGTRTTRDSSRCNRWCRDNHNR